MSIYRYFEANKKKAYKYFRRVGYSQLKNETYCSIHGRHTNRQPAPASYKKAACDIITFAVTTNRAVGRSYFSNGVYMIIEVSNIVLNLIFRSEPLRAQRLTIVRSIPYSKQDVWSAPQSENTFKSFFLPSSPTGSY